MDLRDPGDSAKPWNQTTDKEAEMRYWLKSHMSTTETVPDTDSGFTGKRFLIAIESTCSKPRTSGGVVRLFETMSPQGTVWSRIVNTKSTRLSEVA